MHDLSKHMFEAIRQDPPATVDSMVLRMVKSALTFVDLPTKSGFQKDILDMFSESIVFFVSQ